ncbi:ABC transporter ATP-binding protein [Chitinophaga sp. 212800010-3]|uniref:ABC transporter ATP-binding protein n=1 Tax=unclassified Chitinophaga TaxID=2619133 RepID=UPI002DEA9B60|nr:Fe(3+)-transporting ATPase [Chitinophaga sp. 212800010-3]
MNFLEVSHISKEQHGAYSLKDINFTIQQFQKVVIAGETGSGKSSLMKIIGGMGQADSGTVLFEGKKVKGALEVLIPGHPGTAYLSQHFELRNNYRVEEILSYANKLSEEEASEIYHICRISHLLKRKTDQLSGGEKQRIAMARLLISSPRLFLLDEPYSNLDMIHKGMLKNVIADIGEKLGITCMLISHDPMDILPWADLVIVMKDGEIVQMGTPQEIYRRPANAYVAGLFGKYNLVAPASAKAFAGLPGISLNGKHIFLRPEDLKITGPGKNAITGKVAGIAYYGSFLEANVAIGNEVLTVRTDDEALAAGTEVHLTLAGENVWHFSH